MLFSSRFRGAFFASFLLLALPAFSAPFDQTPTRPVVRVVPSAFDARALEKWKTIASGSHSLRKLGPAFYVDLPMRPIAGAKLAYFNHGLAKRLGLSVPEDPRELERLMTSLFAIEKDPEGKSPLKMMATRYQDSSKKGPGQANGDGRAVWTGELEIPLPDGKVAWVDFTAKGIGQTPLAWTNNDPAHSDGRQKARELVRSAIISRANARNELDSTDDLMGFIVREEGHAPRTVTIRAGNQTRTAHFRYFADSPKRFRSIFEYIVRRDSGLKPGTAIGPAETKAYLEMFVDNLAEETARYADLDAIHGSPTAGNRTTKGSTIDLMEFWYHDAHHGNFSYLFDRLQAHEQYDIMESYIADLRSYMATANYPTPKGVSIQSLSSRFRKVYEEKASAAWLNRLGLSPGEIADLDPKVRKDFFKAVRALRNATGTAPKKIFWNTIEPAAFDLRSILAKTFELWTNPNRKSLIFVNERPWATELNKTHTEMMGRYLDSVAAILWRLRAGGNPNPEWIEKARTVGRTVRMIPAEGAPAAVGDPFFHAHDEKILAALESKNFDFQKVDEMIEAAAAELVDPGLIPRGTTNLGLSPGFPRLPKGNFAELCRVLFVAPMPLRLAR
jgi:uncharacterized protein YdiU (UPF0061 family)